MKAFLLLLCIIIAPFLKAEQNIVLSNGEWKPYISEEYPQYGPFSQIVTESFALQGIKVEYQFFPWNRAVHMAQIGALNGSIAITNNEERKKKFWYSKEPVIIGERVFFHLKSRSVKWNDLIDLKNLRIGATREYFYGNTFESYEKNKTLNIERVISDKANFKKLLANRIDLFPVTKEVGYHILRSEFSWKEFHQISHNDKPLSTTAFYIILTKKLPENEAFMKAFDKGFKQLKQSGRYDEILQMIE